MRTLRNSQTDSERIGHTFWARAILLGLLTAIAAWPATLGPSLSSKLSGLADSASAGTVIVAFNTSNGLNASHMAVLTAAGVARGYTMQHLGMVAVPATAGQVRALSSNAAVRSIWANDQLDYLNNETRVLTGVDRARTDPNFIKMNGGMPVSGKGNFSVELNDSGIDGTHSDVHYPEHVIQNVQQITDTATLSGFTSLVFVENVPNTDTNSGHGSHCAGIIAGTGAASGGLYAGVAPGANLIGVGSGATLLVLNALGGFEYALANQFRYNIRVISNSWGTTGAFDPNDPINIASKAAHDNNIIVAFAAGNSGPGKDTMNPYATPSWVIGVAAGTKEGGLASFSSRGLPAGVAPSITAPGTGREFASDSGMFTTDIVSVRAKTNLVANGQTADAELPTQFIPFYTEISGTSMATPFVAGSAALLLSVDPTLSADDVKQILMQTASQMPGFSQFEVGAGYINVYAAIDKVFNRSKNYGTYSGPLDKQHYNASFSATGPAPTSFHVDYTPAALPGPGSPNSVPFVVQPNMSVLDVLAHIGDLANSGNGNTVGLLLTDPNGNVYSGGIAIPVLDAPTREVVVANPVAGNWLLEVRGIRGLTTLPEVRLPTSGAALPGPVDGTITQQQFILAPVPDIQGDPSQAEINFVLTNRIMDTFSDGLFHPTYFVTRGDLAQTLVLNTALRQSLAAVPIFTDVTGAQEAIAEAVTANGSTLRDYNFGPAGLMSASGSTFNPGGAVSRLDVAVALVRALGQDAAAQALAGSDVTVSYNGQNLVLSDESQIPAALRGYVQIALNRQLLQAFFTLTQGPNDFQPTVTAQFRPADSVTRSLMAFALDHYRRAFSAGN
ncbi:MAG TPA: S8 family serine peptidase [Bryobacteraceae bacterium]|nr:S8 family serine peptidase [Bryobacteraceae bacterium]